jgi:acetyl-CoA acetyltransferase
MRDVFICDAVRTPIGRFGGSLAKVRADDLAAAPIKALMAKHSKLDWSQVDEVFFGCANQAGEDNRNVARMALLLAGMPESVPGQTLNRLCASGLDAVGAAGRAIRAGEIDFAIAGGVESMTRAPFVMGKAPEAFSRSADIFDTTIGWRFINPLMKAQYGVDAMPETRKRRRGIPGVARRSGRIRHPLAAARRRCDRLGLFRRRNRSGFGARRQGGPDHSRQGRASAPGNHARRIGKTEADRAQPGHGDRGQCVRRQ